jgi:hypothetical protein
MLKIGSKVIARPGKLGDDHGLKFARKIDRPKTIFQFLLHEIIS